MDLSAERHARFETATYNCFLFDVLARTHTRKFDEEELTTLEDDMKIAISLLERDCTVYLANITTHLLQHIISKMKDNGPLYAFWMYAFERMNSWITRRVMNRAKIEECVMETKPVRLTIFLCYHFHP